MDWYYPVLSVPCPGEAARDRLESRWDEFVLDGVGVRCVSDQPWVTAAETAECVMALDAIGMRDNAAVHGCSTGPGTCATTTAPTGPVACTRSASATRAASAPPTPPRPCCWPTTPCTATASAGLFRGETLPVVVAGVDLSPRAEAWKRIF
jgi:hypothetical protein